MKEWPFDPYDFFGYLAAGLVVIAGLDILFGVPSVLGRDLKPLDLTLVVLAAYVAGQLMATPAKWLLEDLVVHGLLNPPSVHLVRNPVKRSPVLFLFWEYFSPLPTTVRSRIVAKSRSEGLEALEGEPLFVHIRFRDYVRADSVLMARLGTFLGKYGFCRNLSFVAILFSVCVLIGTPFNVGGSTTRYALIAGVAGLLLFFRFIKFYRQYAYELFNAYAGRA